MERRVPAEAEEAAEAEERRRAAAAERARACIFFCFLKSRVERKEKNSVLLFGLGGVEF